MTNDHILERHFVAQFCSVFRSLCESKECTLKKTIAVTIVLFIAVLEKKLLRLLYIVNTVRVENHIVWHIPPKRISLSCTVSKRLLTEIKPTLLLTCEAWEHGRLLPTEDTLVQLNRFQAWLSHYVSLRLNLSLRSHRRLMNVLWEGCLKWKNWWRKHFISN